MCKGKLFIVGIGPGHHDMLTGKALKALQESDVIVGYTTYIDLLKGLIDNKEIVSTGMTKEITRVQQALDHAAKGKKVALVSSGDPGVYGMAGLAFELHSQEDDFDIEVIPGVTAATSCASLLGAPIMHDSAVISLSDRLTEKELIIKRVELAALGDFVIILYNPRSKTRKKLFDEVCDLLEKNLNGEIPVGLVWHAYRPEERKTIIKLSQLKENAPIVDMFTTILIGNSTTKVKNGRMITARGYEKKMPI